jgi:hypothetical protein
VKARSGEGHKVSELRVGKKGESHDDEKPIPTPCLVREEMKTVDHLSHSGQQCMLKTLR